MRVLNIVGTRPNFIKMAPLLSLMQESSKLDPFLLHTGQHIDREMSDIFFDNLKIRRPDLYLGCAGGSHGEQTAKVMLAIEPILVDSHFDLMVVVGDVNSTLACSLVASKLHIPIAHVESGLRSFDREMPEEINRSLVDTLSDYLFTTCEEASYNLLREGVAREKIFFVGNIMIDTLHQMLPIARNAPTHKKLGVPEVYGLITLHRPSNVDSLQNFCKIVDAFEIIQREIPLFWPLHPRTKMAMKGKDIEKRIWSMSNLKVIDPPLGYIDTLALMEKAQVVLTDSGGIQEETTIIGVPCLTLRENTERPVTMTQGTNLLVGIEIEDILQGFYDVAQIVPKPPPPLWDGQTASRIVKILEEQAKAFP